MNSLMKPRSPQETDVAPHSEGAPSTFPVSLPTCQQIAALTEEQCQTLRLWQPAHTGGPGQFCGPEYASLCVAGSGRLSLLGMRLPCRSGARRGSLQCAASLSTTLWPSSWPPPSRAASAFGEPGTGCVSSAGRHGNEVSPGASRAGLGEGSRRGAWTRNQPRVRDAYNGSSPVICSTSKTVQFL